MSAARKLREKAQARDVRDARVVWPSPAWRGRHVEFARDVLGKRTVAPHQIKILDEYYKPSVVLSVLVFIVVCTGQKLGKTEIMIICAAFDFATEPRLNGFVFGPKLEHTNEVFWPRFALDVLNAYYPCSDCMPEHRAWCALVESNPFDETPRPERCPKCSPLVASELKDPKDPRKGRKSDWLDPTNSERGLRAPDGRAIRGYAGRKEGSKGGFSGNVRFYVDEASDVSDVDRETIAGNLSGGGKAIAYGNMLHNHGWFYRAFKNEQNRYSFVFQLSSRMSPNCPGTTKWSDGVITANDNAGRPIPGMATREGIEANLRAWRGTNYVAARIDAKPPQIVAGQLTASAVVYGAEKRWQEGIGGEGALQIGVDVARMRDALVIVPRRGRRIIEIHSQVMRQDDHAAGAALVADYARKHRKPGEDRPRVIFDKSGKEGQDFARELQRYEDELKLHGVIATFPPRDKKRYHKIRDEIEFHFAEWLKMGALPPDPELEAEIEITTSKAVMFRIGSAQWEVQEVITNDEVRKILGRSPDKRNACALATWKVDFGNHEEEPANDAPPVEAKTEPSADASNVVPIKPKVVRRAVAVQQDDDFASDYYGAADAGLRAAWGMQ